MNKFLIALVFVFGLSSAQNSEKIIARQGQVSFFSYTSVENIKAENNQVLSIIDLKDQSIAVSMLMNAFIFEKALMKEHFNESYIESDIYPRATFKGKLLDFNPNLESTQVKMIKGVFEMHGQSQELEIKAKIENVKGVYKISGSFETLVSNYKINIPPLLAGNIAKSIKVDFKFEYQPYED